VITKLRRMELTDPYTGSRRSRDKRMAASRERSGSMLHDTSETGRTTRRTVSAFTFTRTGCTCHQNHFTHHIMFKKEEYTS
jgi:hypothetical protein